MHSYLKHMVWLAICLQQGWCRVGGRRPGCATQRDLSRPRARPLRRGWRKHSRWGSEVMVRVLAKSWRGRSCEGHRVTGSARGTPRQKEGELGSQHMAAR